MTRTSIVSLVLGAVAWSGAAAAGALDQPAFTAKPAALLAAARKAPAPDASVVVLRSETAFAYDAQGRATRTYRTVAVIEKPSGVDDWGTIELSWQPFYQDRPTIVARVISPDGKIAPLDPTLIQDAPAVSDSPQVFSDRRTMQAPLPRLVVGAVVEQVLTIKDREPLLAAGTTDLAYVTRDVPIDHGIVTISAPTSLALRVTTRGLAKAPAPRRTTRAGRTTWRYDLGAQPADGDRDLGVPGDVYADPYIGVTTGASWSAVAAGYAAVVGDRLSHPVPLPDGVRAAAPRTTVDRALAWLHAHVRYTGIELADSAIVPASPADTVHRGFGDCKDMATLLVALLRSAGVDADVALLLDGPGTDVDPGLPGLGQFDHAIVRARVAGQDVWIDATEPDLPAGQLPSRDQGRLALIVAPTTRVLVATPASPPRDNLTREVRTFHLAEVDYATVTEVTREHGVFWDDLRTGYRDTSHAELEKSYGGYVEGTYQGKLAGFSGAVPADVTQPFDLTIEVKEVHRAYTGRDQIDVWLPRGDTLAHVSKLLKDGDSAAAVARRAIDYVWWTPSVYEIENRLVLPPGYTAPTLTPRDVLHLGTMTLTTLRRLDGNTLVITYCLDTGKRRITPAELRAGRDAVQQLLDGPTEHVIIAQTGTTLLRAGKAKEAIAEYQRLIALHPREALHYDQLADAYRRLGMGAAARRAARKAIEVEPTSGDAYAILGYELSRDSLGRGAGWDADRAGALAAYRKALELMPHHLGAMEDLAALLAVDAQGRPTSDRRDLLEAVDVLRRAKQISGGHDYDQRLVEALLSAGDYAGAEEAARALPESVEAEGLRVAAAAARSPADAIALAGAITTGGQRDRVLAIAIARLMRLRRYDDMRALEGQRTGAGSDPARAAMIANLGRIDASRLPAADPRRPALLAIVAMTGDPVPRPPWDHDAELDLAAVASAAAPQLEKAGWHELAPQVRGDAVMAVAKLAVEGNATDGWRVTADFQGTSVYLYVELDHGRARLVGGSALPGSVGRRALTLLDHHDLAGAAHQLQRYADDVARTKSAGTMAAPPPSDVLTIYRTAAAEAGSHPPPRAVVELVAGSLLAVRDPGAALPHLQGCRTASGPSRIACRGMRMAALVTLHRWREGAAACRDFADVAPTPQLAAIATAAQASALAALGQHAEAVKVVDAALARAPGSEPLLAERAMLAIVGGPWKDAQPWIDKAVASPDVSWGVLNDIAWARLYFDPDATRARALGERAARLAGADPAPFLRHTLATIDADTDEPFRAWQGLRAVLDSRPDGKPTGDDWYVIGRIAQDYGLRDDAIAAYRRVGKPDIPHQAPSAYDFAQRDLKALGAGRARAR